ncbi:dTDP-glucose 4,6-dehydratase [Candidatus Daviesbacteria bacterium RIFCSPHIGHO2_02_FULL_41_14]|uniref:dTDP-glucose 4,6-dehydratase n=1 Tax=Candidatus Daviesbacteria bacterium RIFCSPLOWO2_01_FULL_40_24 TaxID=1797787 RepID=A0A1F5MKG8_9BACT|nr:MAG: dTDP-glucose 4,6-dehydratase [Candidatus Daviesbacteria bacterium RIFCSPHIGHO2_01_FULL_41_45]OGE35134.1 MAG: dTDP-glucose 4,6-dehydratase [Candidatus Daviesbacteria bacterium RIFCSPHIGHO2_02_FULL_41_14]OGE65790.1 MAG: dTDP-glucose 4,6-dehydratase [Candidatus Daviesbacteria bacterium RIFCSPLOWO2_01_FULL_40_24]
MKILITGGAGFIGSNFIHYWVKQHLGDQIINFDALTYAGHLESLKDLEDNPNYRFIKGDITNSDDVQTAMNGIDIVVHFAAESHVDRSIIDPLAFVKTNVLGTGILLDAALKNKVKRFHHISTDEVFGDLQIEGTPFDENTPYDPRSPYAASKAGSDHLVRAYFKTYGLPVTVTNCANNYGPYHDPEKLIPRFITYLLTGKNVPLMGKGENIREWIYADDHTRAIELVLNKGVIGETYCVGGEEKTNLQVTKRLLDILKLGEDRIEYVQHRLGHDFRYAINDKKIRELGWEPKYSFNEGLNLTVEWYKNNTWWWKTILDSKIDVDPKKQREVVNNQP